LKTVIHNQFFIRQMLKKFYSNIDMVLSKL